MIQGNECTKLTICAGRDNGGRLIKERSGSDFLVEEGALYPALHRLEKKGWVESEWGISDNNRKAKYYQLTPLGRAALKLQIAEWERYTRAVAGVLQVAR